MAFQTKYEKLMIGAIKKYTAQRNWRKVEQLFNHLGTYFEMEEEAKNA